MGLKPYSGEVLPLEEEAQESSPSFVSPVTGKMGGGFHDKRDHGPHKAGDLSAPAGSPLVAPETMRFIQGRQGGRYLRDNDWWSHWEGVDTGVQYRFAHHDDISGYKPGDTIPRGEQWNVVGSAVDDPHLHMALHDTTAGKHIDWMTPLGLKRGQELAQGQSLLDGLEQKAGKIAATVPAGGGLKPYTGEILPLETQNSGLKPYEGEILPLEAEAPSLSSRIGKVSQDIYQQPGSAEEASVAGFTGELSPAQPISPQVQTGQAINADPRFDPENLKSTLGISPPRPELYKRAADKKLVPFKDLHPLEQAEINRGSGMGMSEFYKGIGEGATLGAIGGEPAPVGMETWRTAGRYAGILAPFIPALGVARAVTGAAAPLVAAETLGGRVATSGLAGAIIGAGAEGIKQSRENAQLIADNLMKIGTAGANSALDLMLLHYGGELVGPWISNKIGISQIILGKAAQEIHDAYYRNLPDFIAKRGVKGGLPAVPAEYASDEAIAEWFKTLPGSDRAKLIKSNQNVERVARDMHRASVERPVSAPEPPPEPGMTGAQPTPEPGAPGPTQRVEPVQPAPTTQAEPPIIGTLEEFSANKPVIKWQKPFKDGVPRYNYVNLDGEKVTINTAPGEGRSKAIENAYLYEVERAKQAAVEPIVTPSTAPVIEPAPIVAPEEKVSPAVSGKPLAAVTPRVYQDEVGWWRVSGTDVKTSSQALAEKAASRIKTPTITPPEKVQQAAAGEVFYHGTGKDQAGIIKEKGFAVSNTEPRHPGERAAIFITTSPDIAESYAIQKGGAVWTDKRNWKGIPENERRAGEVFEIKIKPGARIAPEYPGDKELSNYDGYVSEEHGAKGIVVTNPDILETQKSYPIDHFADTRKKVVPSPPIEAAGAKEATPIEKAKAARDAKIIAGEKSKYAKELSEGWKPIVYETEDTAKRNTLQGEYDRLKGRYPMGNPTHPETIRFKEVAAQLDKRITKSLYRLESPTTRERVPITKTFYDSFTLDVAKFATTEPDLSSKPAPKPSSEPVSRGEPSLNKTRGTAGRVGVPKDVISKEARISQAKDWSKADIEAMYGTGVKITEITPNHFEAKFPGGVTGKIEKNGTITLYPKALQEGYGRAELKPDQYIAGSFRKIDSDFMVRVVSGEGLDTLSHEAVGHPVFEMFATPREQKAILRDKADEIATAIQKWEQENPGQTLTTEQKLGIARETAATALGKAHAEYIKSGGKVGNPMERSIIQRMIDFFRRLLDAIYPTWKSALRKMRSGEMFGRNGPSGGAGGKPGSAYSVKNFGKKTSQQIKDIKKIPNKINEVKTLMKSGLKSIWTSYKTPKKWTDFDSLIGEYLYQRQLSSFKNKQFINKINEIVPDRIRQEGITNWIQAGGDNNVLNGRMLSTTDPDLRLGYEAAINLSKSEIELANEIKTYFNDMLDIGIKTGLLEGGLDNYITQIWKKEPIAITNLRSEINAGLLNTNFNYAKKRFWESYFEGEQGGGVPKDKRVAFLVGAYHQSFAEAIAARMAIKSLLSGKASDGNPLATVSGIGKTIGKPAEEGRSFEDVEPGYSMTDKPKFEGAYLVSPHGLPKGNIKYRYIEHPALRKWKWIQNDVDGHPIIIQGDIWVHPDIYKGMTNLLYKSAIRQNIIGRGALSIVQNLKGTMLSLSGFHQVQEGVHAVFHKVNPFNTSELNFDDPLQQALVKHSLMVHDHNALAEFSEGVYSTGLINKIPGIGIITQAYGEYLFNDLIPRLKMATAIDMYHRNKKRYEGKYTEDQILYMSANQANAAYGELNYKWIFSHSSWRNATNQDLFRLALLAPDFLEARAKFVGQAGKIGGREQFTALLRGAVGLYILGVFLNLILGDDNNPQWDKPFTFVKGGRDYALRSIPGDLIHLIRDPRSFSYHRLNPTLTRTAIEWLTGRDVFGRKRSGWDQIRDFFTTHIPIPLQGVFNEKEQNVLQSGLQSIGVASYKHKTKAERLMADYAKRIDKITTPEDVALSKEKRNILELIRQGKTAEVDKAFDVLISKIGEKKADRWGSSVGVTRLQKGGPYSLAPPQATSFKRLNFEQALDVYEVANTKERKIFGPVLETKWQNLSDYDEKKYKDRADKIIRSKPND